MAKKVKVKADAQFNLGRGLKTGKLFVTAQEIMTGSLSLNNQQRAKRNKIKNRIEIIKD